MNAPAAAQVRPETGLRGPDFIVIGAMKAGTTTLFEHLRRHPSLFMADPKEPNYFSIDEVYARGPEWYHGLFAGAGDDQLCGEASPSYTRYPRFPETPARMAEGAPHAKLIYLMRHPVDRFYSNYVFDRSFGHREPLRDTLTERPYVLETSRYLTQIRRYLEHFPREQMLCLLLDDLKADPAGVLAQVARFLGVADFADSPGDEPVLANQRGQQHTVRQGNRLLAAARSAPGVKGLTGLLPESARASCRRFVSQTLPQSPVGRWLASRHHQKIDPLTDELRAELHDRLDPDTAELENFLGRNLSHWRRVPQEAAS